MSTNTARRATDDDETFDLANAHVVRRGPRRDRPERRTLRSLREAARLTQAELSGKAGILQPELSRIERKDDVALREMVISTLVRMLEALGGKLELVAVFPKTGHRMQIVGYEGEPAELGDARPATWEDLNRSARRASGRKADRDIALGAQWLGTLLGRLAWELDYLEDRRDAEGRKAREWLSRDLGDAVDAVLASKLGRDETWKRHATILEADEAAFVAKKCSVGAARARLPKESGETVSAIRDHLTDLRRARAGRALPNPRARKLRPTSAKKPQKDDSR